MFNQDRLKELLDYSKDGSLVWRVNKGRAKAYAIAGSRREDGYYIIQVDGKRYMAHRLVFLYHHGYLPESDIDHIDRDPSNNRIENLREVSKTCNQRNKDVSKISKYEVPGVVFDKIRKKWRVVVGLNHRTVSVGRFDDFVEAVAHRLAAEQALGWPGCFDQTPAFKFIKKFTSKDLEVCPNA